MVDGAYHHHATHVEHDAHATHTHTYAYTPNVGACVCVVLLSDCAVFSLLLTLSCVFRILQKGKGGMRMVRDDGKRSVRTLVHARRVRDDLPCSVRLSHAFAIEGHVKVGVDGVLGVEVEACAN